VSFTGSTATGRTVMAAAAGTLKKTFLELGGKSAYIVLDDADAATAAIGVRVPDHGARRPRVRHHHAAAGASGERHDEIVDQVDRDDREHRLGRPDRPRQLHGPARSPRPNRTACSDTSPRRSPRERRWSTGGRIGQLTGDLAGGFFVEPTVLVGVHQDSTIAQEEVFGPVLAVIPHDGDDDAVAIANNSAFGLSGAVVSADVERARSVARRVRTGTIGVNGGIFYSPDVPFGGYKQSGIGREMGVAGFEEYLEIKSIAEGI
jgi:aldehyde dehydrogenase (NAD+)